MRIRTRILCLVAAVLAAAPLVWAGPAHAAGSVIHAHGENRGPGGGGGDDIDEDDDDDDARAVTPTTAVPQGSAGAVAAPAAPGPAAVSIVDGGFQPAALAVAAGSQVMWTNTDSSRHTATADSGAFDSGSLNAGGAFSFTFARPGTFSYFCAFHSDMQGTVTVGGPAAAAAPASPAPTSATTATTARATPAAAPTTAPTTAGATAATVEARDYEFSPARLTVGRGAEVTWRNTGQAPHTVTGDGFDSGEMAAGATFAHRFATPGTYDYRCALHPRMQGVVEVVADATAAPVGQEELGGFPIERVAAGGIVGAPILLLAGAVFFWGRR